MTEITTPSAPIGAVSTTHAKPPSQKALNIWGIVLFVWGMYRYYFGTSLPPWVDEFIMKPVVFLLPVYYFIQKYEKKPILEAIDFKLSEAKLDAIIGSIIGIVFFLTAAFAHFMKAHTFLPSADKLGLGVIIWFVAVSFASSFSEEILMRGFVLKRLFEESKNMFTSSLYSSFLFFFLHVPILFTNPKIVGGILLQVIFTDIVLSMAVSLMYLQRRNVILAIFVHAFYNLSLYLFI